MSNIGLKTQAVKYQLDRYGGCLEKVTIDLKSLKVFHERNTILLLSLGLP